MKMFFSLGSSGPTADALFCDGTQICILMSYYYFGRTSCGKGEKSNFRTICQGQTIERTVKRKKLK